MCAVPSAKGSQKVGLLSKDATPKCLKVISMNKRWIDLVPEPSVAPKGGLDALQSAKSALAPFDIGDGWVCACEKCAEDMIISIAREFNGVRALVKGAPRAQQIPRKLRDIARKARQLAVALAELDDYSRKSLRMDGAPPKDNPDLRRLYRDARASDLPPSSHPSIPSSGDGLYVQELLNLGKYVDAQADFHDKWGRGFFPRT